MVTKATGNDESTLRLEAVADLNEQGWDGLTEGQKVVLARLSAELIEALDGEIEHHRDFTEVLDDTDELEELDDDADNKCRTPKCTGDPNCGDIWDGYCADCADRNENRTQKDRS